MYKHLCIQTFLHLRLFSQDGVLEIAARIGRIHILNAV